MAFLTILWKAGNGMSRCGGLLVIRDMTSRAFRRGSDKTGGMATIAIRHFMCPPDFKSFRMGKLRSSPASTGGRMTA